MLSAWRLAPAISAALLCVAVASFFLYLVESTRGAAVRNLGYDGETWRVVAVSMTARQPEDRSRVLAEFCEREGASVAFASGDVRSIGIHDPSGRFTHPDDHSFSALRRSGSTPAALLSTAIQGAGREPSDLVPDGVELLGVVTPEVKFDDYYPVLVQNLAAAPPRSGVFRFAGLRPGDEEAVDVLFRDLAMDVVRVDVEEPATLSHVLSSFFGRVVIAFTSLSVVAALLVTNIFMSLDRGRLDVAVLCGATARDLSLLALRRLVPLATVGTLAGAGVVTVLAAVLSGSMLTSPGVMASAVGAALGVCVTVWGVLTMTVSWVVGRRRGRALPR